MVKAQYIQVNVYWLVSIRLFCFLNSLYWEKIIWISIFEAIRNKKLNLEAVYFQVYRSYLFIYFCLLGLNLNAEKIQIKCDDWQLKLVKRFKSYIGSFIFISTALKIIHPNSFYTFSFFLWVWNSTIDEQYTRRK